MNRYRLSRQAEQDLEDIWGYVAMLLHQAIDHYLHDPKITGSAKLIVL